MDFFFNKPIQKSLIYDTWNHAFKKNLPEGLWEWRFLKNPDSKKVYIAYILEDGILASHYAVSPFKLNYNGNLLDFGIINTAMTRPGYEGRGYLSELAKMLHQELVNDGFSGLISFPTRKRTLDIFKYNFDWVDLKTMLIWQINKPVKINKTFSFRSGKFDLAHLKMIEQLNYTELPIFATKNIHNLNWRYLEHPVFEYNYLDVLENNHLCGVIIFKQFNEDFDLMDQFYDNPSDKSDIFAGAVNYLLSSGKSVNSWTTIQNNSDRNASIMHEPEYLDIKTFMGIIPLKENKPDLYIEENWHTTFYDSDVY